MSKRRRRGAQLLALISAITGLLLFVTSGASQAQVPPVTDYATYPPTLPAGCIDGERALVNVQFSANGVTTADLHTLPLQAGQTFTMSWDGFAPGCEGIGIGLSSKVATVPVFDQTTDYWLYAFAYCGPEAGATPCAAGPNTLTLQVPPVAQVPCYQLDTHVGPPLGQVGPTTNYYGTLNGSQSMLISAQNGGTSSCGPLPPCATNPAIPAAAFLCAAQAGTTTTTTTTAPPTTATTVVPPTTATTAAASCAAGQVVDAATGQCVSRCAAGEVFNATTGQCQAAGAACAAGQELDAATGQSRSVSAAEGCATGQVLDSVTGQCRSATQVAAGALPVTGRNSRSLATTGLLFLVSGLCLGYAYRRPGAVAASASH